jgi:hypothetical protein
MRVFRGIAAALAVLGVAAADAGAQSLAGGDVSSARAGFGLALALGENELFIGEPNNSTRPGVIYVYRRGASGWVETAQLTAPEAEPSDGFGQNLVLHGSTLFVGVPSYEENRGIVYVFERSATGWSKTWELAGDDLADVNRFGTAIAVSGDFVFVSAPAQAQGTGAVYVFRREFDGWDQAGKLTADSAAQRTSFGAAVAADGDRLFVGAPAVNENRGAVTVFARDPSTNQWNSTGLLPAPELEPNSRFGMAMTAANGTVIVSAPVVDGATGVAYAFRQADDGAWAQTAELAPEPAVPNTVFGIKLDADGDELLVGAVGADTARGAVFHFVRNADGGWSAPHRISPIDPLERGSQFGGAVAIRDDVAAATVTGADYGLGTVLVFERQNGVWTQRALLTGPTETLASVTGDEVRCSEDGTAADFDCHDVELLSFLSIPDLGGSRGVRLNDIWGWTDPQSGKEYALVGRIDGMSAVDISDPSNPVFVGDLPLTEGATPAGGATSRSIAITRTSSRTGQALTGCRSST